MDFFLTCIKNKQKRMVKMTRFILLLLTALSTVWGALPGDSTRMAVHSNVYPFQPGEKLTFRLRYGFITAGSAVMEVRNTVLDDSTTALNFHTTARSSSGFDWIYKVRDEVNSYVDPHTFQALRFEKKLREGNYKADVFTEYRMTRPVAQVEEVRYENNMRVRTRKKYFIRVPSDVLDILASFYYVRMLPLQVGKKASLTNHEKKKVYDLEIIVHGRETIEVEAGTFRCIVIEPKIKGEGLFKKKGTLKIWLTDDDKKIPVQMTSKIIVGHITSELVRIEGVEGEIPARVR
ncbi:MAG: DUF3108 domain-containing protein [Calditrichaeota bacterium]|nr:MAG: DUF3108 domain-containing protein [Calditrichota bacterium]